MRTIRDPPDPKPVRQSIDWQRLLVDAVTKPGIISSAYTAFHSFSTSNRIWAYVQCLQRDIEVGPIHTFRGWLRLGRHVRKGEKALTLVMPVTMKRKRHEAVPNGALPDDTPADPMNPRLTYTLFIERPFWFALSQTDGEPYTPLCIPIWNEEMALYTLGITREPFRHHDGNCQGYAHGRTVSVSPV
ncbi:MAG TPA: ArdC-like ssDNA-binding domain-containing protein, partial [Tepidisphaeraceae bacterium]